MKQHLSIHQLKQEYGRFRLFVSVIVVIIGCLYSGYRLGFYTLSEHQSLVNQQQQRLDGLYKVSDQQLQQIDFLKVEIEVEKQAGQYVKGQLQLLQEENFKLQKELSFYQKVMAPELEAEGMELDSFSVSKTHSERVFHYKVVLVQTTKRKRFAKGYVELKIKGSLNNKVKTFDIKALIDKSAEKFDKKSLNFSFRYFQILEGDLTLPEGFIAETVFVAAILPTRKWQKYSRLDRQYPFVAIEP